MFVGIDVFAVVVWERQKTKTKKKSLEWSISASLPGMVLNMSGYLREPDQSVLLCSVGSRSFYWHNFTFEKYLSVLLRTSLFRLSELGRIN